MDSVMAAIAWLHRRIIFSPGQGSKITCYFVDGSVSGLRDYWFAGGKLHYVTDYGFENAVDLDAVDLPETVNENALRGVKFTLGAAPMPSSPSPPR